MDSVLIHPGENRTITVDTRDEEDHAYSIKVNLGEAMLFTEYEIVNGTTIEFAVTPREEHRRAIYSVNIILT